ncbi:hypothetical protein N7532_005089 [Penicillium argentinense]|uniref:Phosphorylase n=1 Tax=Penicillium argentinense TaxID=1131581 RepID=A0A9W9FD81_9EURO|nr:uncharacterized protein N7532_005089 [Penicillium argentinense]KAJ5098088.1 hypothetical protein N7532_005089 [Penicillium argentinense]
MPLNISYDEICSKFDRLVSNGIIVYQPSHTVAVTDNGMLFCFHVVEGLKKKPQAGEGLQIPSANSATVADEANVHPKTFGPGSDLAYDHPDECITLVNGTHYLVINKFPVFRPMLLLLTTDSYRRQNESLDFADIDAAWSLVQGLERDHFAFFNCSELAGSSRAHKHLQVIPEPSLQEGYSEGFKFFPDYDPEEEATVPPFVHFLQRFRDLREGHITSSDQLLWVYQRLLQQTRESLKIDQDPCPHNVVLTKRWIVIVPRTTKVFKGITSNAPGMLGSVYISNHDQLRAWKEVGPTKALAELGLSSSNSRK